MERILGLTMKEVNIILKNNGFYDDVNKDIFIGDSLDNIGKEIDTNLVTLGLSDNDKNKITIKDLRLFFYNMFACKKQIILHNNINKVILFRVWHDLASDWLRYTLLSSNISERNEYRKKSKGLEFVKDINIVLQSFLNERSDGFYYLDKDKDKKFHSYSVEDNFDDNFCKWKIYEEEIR